MSKPVNRRVAGFMLPVVIVLSLVLAACAPTLREAPEQDPHLLYGQATSLKNAGQIENAHRLYLRIWERYPNHELAPESLYQAATLASRFNQARAIDLHATFLRTFPHNMHAEDSSLQLFVLYREQSLYEEAATLLIRRYPLRPTLQWAELGISLVRQQLLSGRPLKALDVITVLYPSADTEPRETLVGLWSEALLQVDNAGVLMERRDEIIDRTLSELLLARIEALEHGAPPADVPVPGIVPGLDPGAGEPGQDQSLPAIGVLLPLSGRWQPVGDKTLRGIQLASQVFTSTQTPPVRYVIRDYGDDEPSLPLIVEELVRQEQVVAIVGPIGEKASEITCGSAQDLGIPMVTFTQAQHRGMEGSYCFRNFVSVDIQVKTLLQVASLMNRRSFAILRPDDHFGAVFTELFTEMAPLYGIEVVRSMTYSPQRVDFKEQVKSLAGIEDPDPAVPQTQEDKRRSVPVTPDFDALLIPDTAINAAMIASYITYYNILDVRLFGPSLWDSQDFIRVGGRHVEDAVFVSGFFLESQIGFVQDFADSFYYTFGYPPSVWEASAYDTAVILQNLIDGGPVTRAQLREGIASLKDYPGITGATSFFSDGTSDKVIFVLTVRGSQVLEIQP